MSGETAAAKRQVTLQQQLGEAVKRLRLERDISQVTLCEIAGISRRALVNLEQGHGATIATLVSVVDALGATDWLDALSPPPGVSPMAMLRLKQQQQREQPKRASKKDA